MKKVAVISGVSGCSHAPEGCGHATPSVIGAGDGTRSEEGIWIIRTTGPGMIFASTPAAAMAAAMAAPMSAASALLSIPPPFLTGSKPRRSRREVKAAAVPAQPAQD